jgi:hypothetical protein
MVLDLSNINYWTSQADKIEIKDIIKFSFLDLLNPDIYRRFLFTIADSQYQTDIGLVASYAVELNKLLNKYSDLSKENEEMYQKYQEIVEYLVFQSLPIQPRDIVFNLFKENLTFAILSQINIKDKLDHLFVTYNYAGFEWENIRTFIIKALRENEEKIGIEKIKINQEEREPMVKNWLSDYLLFSQTNKGAAALNRTTYLQRSTNVSKLNSGDKKNLTEILEIYDYLDLDLRWQIAAEKNGLIFIQKLPTDFKTNNLIAINKEKKQETVQNFPTKQANQPKSFEDKYLEESGEKEE